MFVRRSTAARGQALVEFALVFPLAMMVIFGIISLGLWVFYQQQMTNVAREGARYAAVHSAQALCATSSWREPAPIWWGPTYRPKPLNCDGPDNPRDAYPWPFMTRHARSYAWGIDPNRVHVNACWSGWRAPGASSTENADWPAVQPDAFGGQQENVFQQCTIAGIDPTTQASALPCGARLTTYADDPASGIPDNLVTVYACMTWSPPMAGFLLIPQSVTIRAVVTETIHNQQ